MEEPWTSSARDHGAGLYKICRGQLPHPGRGDTVVLCNASVEERVPPHVSKGAG